MTVRPGRRSANPVLHALIALLLCWFSSGVLADAPGAADNADGRLYAKVGDSSITLEEYKQAYLRSVRQRYYHSRPPDDEVAAFRESVARDLVTRHMLLQEAARQGIRADDTAIQDALEKFERKYAGSARWQDKKTALLAVLRNTLEQDDLLRQLEQRIRNNAPPTQAQVKAYYEANPDKFTEPMREKLSLILLVVDPASPTATWDAALVRGQALVKDLRAGADFAALARSYSGDASASQGGDMGYLHREMLSAAAQQVVDTLEPGEISDAVRVLQGVAIIRLDEIMPQRLRAFDDVAERARALLIRQRGDEAWNSLKQRLIRDTPVTVYTSVPDIDNDV